jgi:putative protease
MISGPTTGVMYSTVEEIRIENRTASTAQKGEVITIPLYDKVRASDKVYKITSR